jgi:hypothetical protein
MALFDWIILIISFVLQFILIPKPQNVKPASLDDFDVPVVEEGKEIGVLSGTEMLKGPNVTWWGDLRTKAIKGERRYGFFGPRATIGHQYYLGMQMVLCHGPADELVEIWVGDKLLWEGSSTGGIIEVFKYDLFGGRDREGGIAGEIEVCMGGPDQPRNDYLAQDDILGADCPAFRGVVTIVLRQVYVGTNTYIKPWAFKLKRIHTRSDNSLQWYNEKASIPDALDSLIVQDMNPAHIIREYLTDNKWAMGYNDADIDDTAFTYSADLFYDEYLGLTIFWVRQETIEEMITIILAHIDAVLYISRQTGKFILKPIRDDYDIDLLPVFEEEDVIEWTEIRRRQPADAITSITVRYTERRGESTDKEGSATFHNDAQVHQAGGVILDTKEYPGVSRFDLAQRLAERDQHPFNAGMITGQLVGSRAFQFLNPGSPFRLVSSRHNLAGEVLRIVDMKFAAAKENTISIKFIQDQFRLGAEGLVDKSEGTWEPPGTDPLPVDPRLVWEMPYAEARRMMGPASLDTNLANDPDFGMLEVAGEEPNEDTTNVYIYVDGVEVEILPFYAPSAFLFATINQYTTAITVTSSSNFDLLEVGQLAAIIDPTSSRLTEIVRIDSFSGNNLGLSRGMLDTVPRSHLSGAALIVFDDFAMADFILRTAGDAPLVKLLTQTIQGTLEYDAAPSDIVTMDSRAIRPLRPANAKVNGLDTATVDVSATDPFPVTFDRRNRLLEQTTFNAWIDADVAPETGQTTTINLIGLDGTTVLNSYTGISGTSQNVTHADFLGGEGYVEFASERDGYISWQAYRIRVLVGNNSTLLPPLFTNTNTFFLPTVVWNATLTPTLFTDTDAFYDILVNSDLLTPSLFTNTNTFYSPIVGVRDLFPALFTNTNSIFVPSVVWDITLTPFLFTDTDTFYNPLVTRDETLEPSLFTDDDTFYAGIVTLENGDQYLLPSLLTNTNIFYAPIAGLPPANLTSSTLDGVACVGDSLSCDQGTWQNGVDTYTYQWKADGVDISGETSTHYICDAEEVNKAITCTVTATNFAGSTQITTSASADVTYSDPYFTDVSGLLHFDGADGSVTFADARGNIWTTVGDAQIDTAQSVIIASGLFDGTDDYLTNPNNSKWQLSNSAFTIETRIRIAATKENMICNKRNATGAEEHSFYVNSSNQLVFNLFTSGSASLDIRSALSAISLNTWYSVCVTRSGDNFYLFINGMLVNSTNVSATASTNTSVMYIGRDGFNTARDFNGHMDEWRFTKDVCRYIRDYIPRTTEFPGFVAVPSLFTDPDTFFGPAMGSFLIPSLFTDDDTFYNSLVTRDETLEPSLFTDDDTFFTLGVGSLLLPSLFTDTNTFHAPNIEDPNFSNVVLLVDGDGADASTSFTDDGFVGRSLTTVGNAQVDTAQSKFGGASILLDGNGDAVQAASHTDFEFGSGQFTIEAWVRFSALTGVHQIVGKWGSAPRSWCLFKSSGANLSFGSDAHTGGQINGAWSPSTNTWYFVTVDRDSSQKIRLYVGGVMLGSSTETVALDTSTKTLRIGLTDSGASDFAGHIDEVRITKGIARYASDSGFTVPTAAFPRARKILTPSLFTNINTFFGPTVTQ